MDWWKDWQAWPTPTLKPWTGFTVWRHNWKNQPTRKLLWRQERRKPKRMLVWSVLKLMLKKLFVSLSSIAHEAHLMIPVKNTFLFSLQTIVQLQKKTDALNLEKQNLEKEFQASTKEAKGKRCHILAVCLLLLLQFVPNLWPVLHSYRELWTNKEESSGGERIWSQA